MKYLKTIIVLIFTLFIKEIPSTNAMDIERTSPAVEFFTNQDMMINIISYFDKPASYAERLNNCRYFITNLSKEYQLRKDIKNPEGIQDLFQVSHLIFDKYERKLYNNGNLFPLEQLMNDITRDLAKLLEVDPKTVAFKYNPGKLYKSLTDPLLNLRNLCSTNKDLYKTYWENIDFWNKVTHRNYINWDNINKFKNGDMFDKTISFFSSLFSSSPPTPSIELTLLAYRHLFTIEKDLTALMNISLHIVEEKDRQPNHKRTNSEGIQPYEIQIKMPMHPIDIQKCLCNIRFFEKKFNYEGPFSLSSIFSPEVRYGLWISELALLTYLKGADEFYLKKYPETSTNKEYNYLIDDDHMAYQYLIIIFRNYMIKQEFYIIYNCENEFLGHYLFTMLSSDSFLQHPPASLLFSLIARNYSIIYLTYTNSTEMIYQGKYRELERVTKDNSKYFGKKFVVNMNSIGKMRRECMQRALNSKLTPNAWTLYQEYLTYESAYKSEIEGLTKQEV